MAAPAAGPRFAPEDPSLPKPWRGLVDGKTGYLYFWNPVTNITQYQRPGTSVSAPVTRPSSVVTSDNHADVDIKGAESGNVGSMPISVSGEATQHQDPIGVSENHQNVSNGMLISGHGGSSTRTITSLGGGSVNADTYCQRHEITVSGNNVPPPFTTYNSTGFPLEILREIRNAGFVAPTPIQAQSWPIALQSRDIVAVAKTGSGKTLGYLIPGFIRLKRLSNDSRMGPTVLVLSPTRELATQIQDEVKKFGSSLKISCTCLYGGAPKNAQLRDLERGVDIVVATPGRLNDILEMKKLSLHQVSYLVLDEADRMLDMGFEPQIQKIVKEVPSRRQTLMFTATWPKEVRKIATDLLVNPVQVNIGKVGELVANKSITQHVEVLSMMEKRRRLEQILRSQERGSKIIIFCSTKKMCDQLARDLMRQFGACAIHGDKSQGERDEVLSHFRTGKCPVLVATDVAARGLDVKDIRAVINYDFPTGIEDYVHRIGRTGRAGATGLAFTFFGDQDAKYARDLIKILEGSGQRVPPEIRDLASSGAGISKPRFRDSGSFGGRGYGSSDRNTYGNTGGEEEKGSWTGKRSRSRSPEKQERKSFHEMMMMKKTTTQ